MNEPETLNDGTFVGPGCTWPDCRAEMVLAPDPGRPGWVSLAGTDGWHYGDDYGWRCPFHAPTEETPQP
jgi:hypothetical protein